MARAADACPEIDPREIPLYPVGEAARYLNLPASTLSLYGLPEFDSLPEWTRRRLAQYEFVNVMQCGLWLESIFLQRLSRRLDPALSRAEYAYLRAAFGESFAFLSGWTSFVAGFFFGIDLLPDQAHGNEAEVFYTLVPDPDGDFGNVRRADQLLEGVPPVMAHEFQHMIHFNQRVLLRDAGLEAPWLSEALAHSAEHLLGNVFLARGDDQRAFDFRIQNYLRAEFYLEAPDAVSPLGPSTPLAVRGAAWLWQPTELQGFAASGDQEYLKLAAERFPDDPLVQSRVLLHDLYPEERQKWIEAFKQSAPENSFPHFLGARELLSAGDAAGAVAEINAAREKTFDDFTQQMALAGEEAYLSAGRNPAEAKALDGRDHQVGHSGEEQRAQVGHLALHHVPEVQPRSCP